jgi:hypothetical protein
MAGSAKAAAPTDPINANFKVLVLQIARLVVEAIVFPPHKRPVRVGRCSRCRGPTLSNHEGATACARQPHLAKALVTLDDRRDV